MANVYSSLFRSNILLLFRFPATMALLLSQAIQLCQNCRVREYDRCPGTVVPGAVTSEDCYNHLNTGNAVQMVSFDPSGLCRAYNESTCMEPPYRPTSSLGFWSARQGHDTGNPTLQIYFLLKKNKILYHIVFMTLTLVCPQHT